MADPTPTLEDIVNQILAGRSAAGTIDRTALRRLLADLGIDVPINMTDVEAAAQALLDARNAVAYSPEGPASLDYIEAQPAVREARDELMRRANALWGDQGGNVFESISSYVTSQVQREQETVSVEQRTSRQYLEVPTPEEFLDRFETGLATHVKEQVQAGKLSRGAGLWLLDNPEVLYNDYMAELGARAAKGEQIFKPVGVGGAAPEFLGTRPGAVETSATEALTKATEQEQSQAQQAATAVQAAGGAATQRQTATTTEQQTVTTAKQKELSQLEQTQQIFARPNLTTVYALSPLEFLQQRTDLEMLYQGQRGAKRREAETATAPPIVLPRRVS